MSEFKMFYVKQNLNQRTENALEFQKVWYIEGIDQASGENTVILEFNVLRNCIKDIQ